MTYMDNPAGLLHFWLTKISSIDNTKAVSEVTAQMLGVDHETVQGRAEVMRFGASMADLCAQTRAEAALLPGTYSPDLLLRQFPMVESAVDQFTNARQMTVHSMLKTIDGSGWLCLELLDEYLHLNRPQGQISEEDRDSLIDKLRDLIDGVTTDDSLPLDVKGLVLDRLMEVEKALRLSTLLGTVVVERATASLVGSLYGPVKSNLWTQVKNSTWYPLVRDVAVGLCLALGAAESIDALTGSDSPLPIEITINHEVAPDPPVLKPAPIPEIVDAEIVEES